MVARRKQGLEWGALIWNGSGSLEKLYKDGSERQTDQQQSTAMSTVMVAFSSGLSSPTPRLFLPGERKVEAEDCNFRGLQSSASEPGEMLLGLGAAVLGGKTEVGGCPRTRKKRRVVTQVCPSLFVCGPLSQRLCTGHLSGSHP